jgi:hypothetical protein
MEKLLFAIGMRSADRTNRQPSLMHCACGEMFDSHQLGENLVHVPRIIAEFDANELRR